MIVGLIMNSCHYSDMIIAFYTIITAILLTLNGGHIMKHLNKFKAFAYVTSFTLLTGCLGPGGGTGVQGVTGSAPGVTGVGNSLVNNLEGALLQNMVGSVLNGQIGSQLPAADQSFRLQQLTNVMQSGSINQSQEWVNPQTGRAMQINPIGQQNYNTQTQQQCQNLQEVATLPNGQQITENRIACLNPQTNQWALVQ